MIELDLHGVSHFEVYQKVEDFLLSKQHQLPVKIIIGNSNTMKQFTEEVLIKHDFKYYIPSYNLGEIIVLR